MDLKIKK